VKLAISVASKGKSNSNGKRREGVKLSTGDDSLPPDDLREAWIQEHAARLREALRSPEVRTRIRALLVDDDGRRLRRLREIEAELQGKEFTIRLRGDDENDSGT
jgi:hypothetical protein